MEFRSIPKTGEKISTIGVGGAKLHQMPENQLTELLELAEQSGVNIIDLAVETAEVFSKVGRALEGRRHKFMLALHLGLTFQEDGQYLRTRDVQQVDQGFERQLAALGTDYADIAYIHYVDDTDDYNQVFASGTYEYALELKRKGRIRKLGFASHQAHICKKFIDDGDFDLFLFSINPAYDFDPVTHNPLEEDLSAYDALSIARDRAELYRLAEKNGVGITVMKSLGAGRLLDARTSPFKHALSVPQCIQYCLDRPGVLSCMIGMQSLKECKTILQYDKVPSEQRDYSFISGMYFEEMLGQCVYCNHCLPCPSQINIASVHKYLDLAYIGDELAGNHYLSLEHRASDCIECGSCEENCPFQVAVRQKMKEAVLFFGV